MRSSMQQGKDICIYVMFLQKTPYGTSVDAPLDKWRADPAVKFPDVDRRRFTLALPNYPLLAA